MSEDKHEFDVALSFAGEDRKHAEKLATLLREHDATVFYDEFDKSNLWGKDLYQHLQSIYKDKARYCIIFISDSYLKKSWTKHELQQAQARAFEANREYVLPLRVDDAVLPGINSTIGYLDLRQTPIEEVALLLLKKLGRSTEGLAIDLERERASWKGDFVEYNGMRVASHWPKRIERAQHQPIYLVASLFDRIRHGQEKDWGRRKVTEICHDCAAVPGQYHVPGCDMEECPLCGVQAITCGCTHEAMTREQASVWENDEDV
jgi:hypothetical protein